MEIFEAAVELFKEETGMAKAAKKADRIACRRISRVFVAR